MAIVTFGGAVVNNGTADAEDTVTATVTVAPWLSLMTMLAEPAETATTFMLLPDNEASATPELLEVAV
jgi:hypothetical protein